MKGLILLEPENLYNNLRGLPPKTPNYFKDMSCGTGVSILTALWAVALVTFVFFVSSLLSFKYSAPPLEEIYLYSVCVVVHTCTPPIQRTS